MKAIVLEQYGGPEVLAIKEIPTPRPGPGSVLVEIHATALNRADLLQRRGLYPPPDPKPAHEVPGLEAAGVVSEVGPDVSGVHLGDRVMALLPGGGYAEAAVIPDRMLIPIPPSLSFEQAAAIPEAFLTAYDGLRQLAVKMGDWVLIHAAASGVGTTAIQLAKAMGAQVIGTAGSPEKVALAKDLGADWAVNYREQDFLTVVKEATERRGVSAILDLVGAVNFERNLAALAVQGRLIFVGTVSGNKAPLDIGRVLQKRLTLIGTALRSRPMEEKMALTQEIRRHVMPLVTQGRIHPVLDQVVDWAEAPAAHQRMEQNLNRGKIVLRIR